MSGSRGWMQAVGALVVVSVPVRLGYALGANEVQAPVGPALTEDPMLREMVGAALARRPEVAAARAQIAAEQARAPQNRALPDPTLSLGIQNDGFRSIQVGKMESSWIYIVASQTFPWPGKRRMREDVVALDARGADVDLRRLLLTMAADVERAYLDLLLVRDQLGLLDRLGSLWQQAEVAARARYEAGEGAQSDLLRAQLEKQRLRQRRWALLAEEGRRIAVLNRLRGRPQGEPIATQRALADLPDPPLPDAQQAVAASLAESPELERARLAEAQADRRVELARRERWPDVTVSAGVMPRGGQFETMWQAGLALNLPVWSLARQAKVVEENQARGQAARSNAAAVAQLLEQRVRERLETLRSLVESNRLYRDGLLVQSQATVKSTLLQYQVGRVTFASVFEALSGYLSDVSGFLESVTASQRVAIAEREISLDAPEASGTLARTTPGAMTAPASGSRPWPEAAPASGSNSALSRM
jgi:outer membrane protein, heavy metal efflux system